MFRHSIIQWLGWEKAFLMLISIEWIMNNEQWIMIIPMRGTVGIKSDEWKLSTGEILENFDYIASSSQAKYV